MDNPLNMSSRVLPKVLFVCDKWHGNNPKNGLSEWGKNLRGSLEESDLALTEVFHFDDYYFQNKESGDKAFLEKVKEWKPEVICLIPSGIPDSKWNVLSWETLKETKNNLKIPIIAIFGDIEDPNDVKISKALLPYVTFNIATASATAVGRMNNKEKYLYMWVPTNPQIYNDPKKPRNISLSYIGTFKRHRLRKINYLKNNNVSVFCAGGESQEHLTPEEYADMYQRSKITLSFSRALYSHVINARPFEAIACGTMLLEQEGFETPKMFIPFIDFVPYTNNKDLLKKAQYYLIHDKERETIARNGWNKVNTLYSAKNFWQKVLDRTLGGDFHKYQTNFSIKTADLSRLPKWRAWRLKFLDALCSTNFGFSIYFQIAKRANLEYWDYISNKYPVLKIFSNKE